jgi:hypothetical protein
MYVMALLLIGSLIIGCSGRVPYAGQTRVAVAIATCTTLVYFLFAQAM